jgi:hypothetical protein
MPSERHKRCLGCGYILDGLPEHRCPECGRPFDPDDPATYLCDQADGRKYFAAALAGLFGVTGPITVANLLGLAFPGQLLGWAVVAMFGIGLLTIAVVLGLSIKHLREPPAAVVHRAALVAALLVSGFPYGIFVGWVALGLICVIVERVLG